MERLRTPRRVRRLLLGGFGGDGAIGICAGTDESGPLKVSSRNLVPLEDEFRRVLLPAMGLEWVEVAVLLLERVVEERDDDLSDDGR